MTESGTQLMLAIREVFAEKAPGGTVLRFGEILEATKARCAFLAEKAPDAAKKALSRALKALEVARVVQRCQIPAAPIGLRKRRDSDGLGTRDRTDRGNTPCPVCPLSPVRYWGHVSDMSPQCPEQCPKRI